MNAKKTSINNEKDIDKLIEKNKLENSALKKVLDFVKKERQNRLNKSDNSKR